MNVCPVNLAINSVLTQSSIPVPVAPTSYKTLRLIFERTSINKGIPDTVVHSRYWERKMLLLTVHKMIVNKGTISTYRSNHIVESHRLDCSPRRNFRIPPDKISFPKCPQSNPCSGEDSGDISNIERQSKTIHNKLQYNGGEHGKNLFPTDHVSANTKRNLGYRIVLEVQGYLSTSCLKSALHSASWNAHRLTTALNSEPFLSPVRDSSSFL